MTSLACITQARDFFFHCELGRPAWNRIIQSETDVKLG